MQATVTIGYVKPLHGYFDSAAASASIAAKLPTSATNAEDRAAELLTAVQSISGSPHQIVTSVSLGPAEVTTRNRAISIESPNFDPRLHAAGGLPMRPPRDGAVFHLCQRPAACMMPAESHIINLWLQISYK